MRERATLVGGTVQVLSTLGVGTTVAARLPLLTGTDGEWPYDSILPLPALRSRLNVTRGTGVIRRHETEARC
jgi:hypothetical protein